MTNIQVYCESMQVEADANDLNVYLVDVDVSQIVSEIGAKEVLDSIDFEDIADYYISAKRDEDD